MLLPVVFVLEAAIPPVLSERFVLWIMAEEEDVEETLCVSPRIEDIVIVEV